MMSGLEALFFRNPCQRLRPSIAWKSGSIPRTVRAPAQDTHPYIICEHARICHIHIHTHRHIYIYTHTSAPIFAQDISCFFHCGVGCQHVSTEELRQESRVARLKQALVQQRRHEFELDVTKIAEALSVG